MGAAGLVLGRRAAAFPWHSRTISTSSDRCTVDDGPILVRRVAEFDGCTASFVDAATEMGYPWVADLNGASDGQAVAAGCRRRAVEHRRRNQDRPGGAFLQPALGRPNVTLMADTRVLRIRFDRRACRWRGRASDPEGPSVLTADRIVLCAGAIGSAQLLMLSGVGPRSRARGCGYSCRAESPVGVRTSRSPGMGAAGGLDADTRSASARGDTHHAERPRDPALHQGLRRHGGGRRRRPCRSAAYRRRADAPRVQRQDARWCPTTRRWRRSSSIATTATRTTWRC